MVTTAEALEVLFPAARNLTDYEVRDDHDGEGQYIAEWNLPDPQPTQAELDAVTEEQVEGARKAKEANIYDFLERVPARLAEIDADVLITQGSPTLNQLTRIVRDMLQWSRREIRAQERDLRLQGFTADEISTGTG